MNVEYWISQIEVSFSTSFSTLVYSFIKVLFEVNRIMENEEILDSGEIYKDPEEDILEFESQQELELESELKLDPSDLDSIKWEPIGKFLSDGLNSHKLIVLSDDKIKFRASFFTYSVGSLFLLTGFRLLYGLSKLDFSYDFYAIFLLLIFALTLIILGFLALKDYTIATKFNKQNRTFRNGGNFVPFVHDQGSFSDIKAVQLSKQEINLVLKNNKRINLSNQKGSYSSLKDAKFLANYLGVPLVEWNKHR